MGKHLVYVAGAFVVIMILCAITASSSSKSTSTTKKNIVTNAIDNIQINEENTVTTNIWDYIRSQQEGDTIGDSNTSQDDEPQLTIVLQ